MRITCPSCAAAYEVPESRLTPHKKVRCARCGGQWVPDRTAGDAGSPEPTRHSLSHLPAESLPPVTAMDRLAASPSPPPPPTGLLLGAWVLTAVVLVAALTATVVWREAVIRAWPPSALVLAPFSQAPPEPGQMAGKKLE
jgi:predicted Zn finger-like uncharacterized protein